MSVSPSSHMHEGDSNHRHPGSDGGQSAPEVRDSNLHGTLPAVPQDEAQAPVQRPLFEVMIRAHQEPLFVATISRLLAKGGPAAPEMMWGAIQEILDKGPSHRAAIAWDIAEALCRHAKRNSFAQHNLPSAKTVADLIAVNPQGAWAGFKQLRSYYALDALEVALRLSPCAGGSPGTRAFGFICVKEGYMELAQREENLPRIAALLKTAVARREPTSLEACLFIRDRYESCRGWLGKEAEAAMLWRLRDDLTKLLLKVPVACEGNLKISLLYPREIPHPALGREPQRLLTTERWILEQSEFLTDALGNDHASKLPVIDERGDLDSSHFIYLGSFPDVRFRGIQSVTSRFDRDSHVLMPLARGLGIEVPGIWEPQDGKRLSTEIAPRNWVSREDEERYEASQVTLACRCVAAHYWKPDVSERSRQGAYEFLRALIRERPYHLALAAPGLRKWHGEFYLDMLRTVRDEALNIWRQESEASGSNHVVRGTVVLLDALGSVVGELNRLGFDELTVALGSVSASLMNDIRFAAFIAGMRTTFQTSRIFEERAAAALERFPDTLCAAQLARNLSEVRAPKNQAVSIIHAQACRRDLEVTSWLNYAHSSLVYGANPEIRNRLRDVFEKRYDRPIRMLARWSPKARSSYRIVIAALYPERVGEISSLRSSGGNLFHSSLEVRMKAAIDEIPHLSVQGGTYIPWAPAIDGVLRSSNDSVPPVVLLIDGEPYHSVNGSWPFRGFDGHSLLVTKILTGAGYPVLRISAQLGEASEREALRSSVCDAIEHLATGAPGKDPHLVIDAPDDYKDIVGKALLYRPTVPAPRLSRNPEINIVAALLDTLNASEVGDENERGES